MGGRGQTLINYDGDLDSAPIVIQETVPTSSYKNNSKVRLSFNAAGSFILITETIAGTAYYKKVQPGYDADSVESTYLEFAAASTSL